MRTLITADLHLTTRPNDAYRWKLFEWLRGQRFGALFILGDLTDEKDCHGSQLVNRVVVELTALADDGVEVHILKGNHDYAEAASPFFSFLSRYPNCFYHSDFRIMEIGNVRWAFFPHMRKPDWGPTENLASIGVGHVCCHQVFSGATAASGNLLCGDSCKPLEGIGKVWSGDVHQPQVVGPVEYVGAPYPVHFGDGFKPRVVLLDGDERRDLYPPNIRKLVLRISDPEQIEYRPGWRAGDQVKVELSLCRSQFDLWEEYRRKIKSVCSRNDLVLCGLELKERRRERLDSAKPAAVPRSPADQFDAYVRQTNVDETDACVGRELL